MSDWTSTAIALLEADANRSADTHLHPFPSHVPDVDLYLKDESVHPTGSLKHRLARSLFLYGLCNGDITEGSTVVEASSGSTAVSEAYFARMLGLPFIAVMPAATSPAATTASITSNIRRTRRSSSTTDGSGPPITTPLPASGFAA